MGAIVSRRRTLFAAAGSVVIGSGITAGAAASVADLVPASPDAGLVSLCAQFDRLERRRQDAINAATTMQEDCTADLLFAEFRGEQDAVLNKICVTPAVTRDGMAAVAASLMLWDGEIFIEEDDPNGYTNDRLAAALLRSALAGRVGA